MFISPLSAHTAFLLKRKNQIKAEKRHKVFEKKRKKTEKGSSKRRCMRRAIPASFEMPTFPSQGPRFLGFQGTKIVEIGFTIWKKYWVTRLGTGQSQITCRRLWGCLANSC